MKRILVIGSSGAGKSTLAKHLHSITGLKLIHLDRFYHQPNWGKPTDEEWLKIVMELIQEDEWIMDGNYGGTMEVRMERSDTVIWLDLPRTVCTWRILKRTFLYRNMNRSDMAEGCNERFDWGFTRYVWNFPRDTKPKIEARIKKYPDKKIFHLKSQRQVENFFAGILVNG
jgi:adenylate kinase family enzyme